MTADTQPPLGKLWRASLWLAALGGWLALIWNLAAPSEAGSALLFGYSAQRLLLAALLLAPSLFFTRHLFKQSALPDKRFKHPAIPILAGIAFLACWVLLFLPEARAAQLLGTAAGYLPRLAPLLAYATLLAALTLLLTLAARYGLQLDTLRAERPIWRSALWIFAILLGLWALIALTGLGLGFDLTEWNAPGAPLLSSQVFLAAALGLVVTWLARRLRFSRLDTALFLLIWLAAALLWLAQPAGANYYSSAPVAPNYEPYPLSDAFNHDAIASNVLVGEGFRFGGLRAVRKPLYDAALAGLHLLSGGDYATLINWQVILLALFPAALFLLSRHLHGRLAGLILAGLIALREANAIRLGDVINLSHAKLLMADLPAALALAGFALLVFHWLSKRPRQSWLALAAGGGAGLMLLLRSQNLTLIPAILLLALLALRQKGLAWRPLLVRLLLFVVGVALAAGPWLARNKSLTGEFIIEQSTAASYLAQRYSEDPDQILTAFMPGETEGEYYARHMAQVKDYIFGHPGEVAAFVADNYLRNLYLAVMPLPLSFELRDLKSHVLELPYWPSWDGHLLPETWLPLTLNLLLIALGLAAAWRRWGWAGLTPLAINLGFTLNLALARVSGWRYNQPVDWTLILYFALGLSQLLVWACGLLGQAQGLEDAEAGEAIVAPLRPWRQLLVTGALLLALGSAPIVVEALTQPQYEATHPTLVQEWLEAIKAPAELRQQVSAGQVHVLHGAALYPRLYRAGEGIQDSEFLLTAVRDFDRLTFYLIGPDSGEVLLPISTAIEEFPAREEVLVFQCAEDKARIIAVIDMDLGRIYVAPPDQQCGGL